MTEDDAIRIARCLIDDQKMRVGNGIRVVNLERHLAKCEADSGQSLPEHVRAYSRGKFVVWFETPHAAGVVLAPGEIGVEVDSTTGKCTLIQSL